MVRRCTAADERAWAELNRQFMLCEYDEANVWESPLERGEPAEAFRRVMAQPDGPNMLFMIEEDGRPIGFMNTVGFYSIWAHGRALLLDDFFIVEPLRGQGRGRAALAELEALASAWGYVRIQLLAEDTNPGAVAFYLREGYARQRLNFFCKYL